MNEVAVRNHIAIFLPSLRGGGAERVMVTLANGFAARGHRVDLVLARAEGPYLAEVAQNVRIVDLNKGRVSASLLPLAGYLRREKPDAMLSALNHANIIAILARKLARVKTRLVVSERISPTQAPKTLKKKSLRVLMRRLYPLADSIVCISNGVKRDMIRLLGLPEEKVVTIHNPLDVDHVMKQSLVPNDHPWFQDPAVPVFVTAGRLTEQKDYPTLLSAFSLVRAQRTARLIILGQGEEEESLKELANELQISDDVSFMGFQKNPFSFMAQSDVFVLASAWEGFGNVIVEAMACGTPIICTDCPSGPSEILEDGRWGRLAPVGDASALAKAMIETLDDATPPQVRSRAEDFRPDDIIFAYLRALETS